MLLNVHHPVGKDSVSTKLRDFMFTFNYQLTEIEFQKFAASDE